MYLRRGHNKRALLIGINYGNSLKSEGFQVLHTSFRDVDSIRDCLVECYGYSCDDIVIMKDDPNGPLELVPTKDNLLEQLKRLLEGSQVGDSRFLYYTGHGTQLVARRDSTEDDGLDEAIVPCDHKGEAVDKDGRQLDPDKLRPEDVDARGRVDALIKDNIIREFIDKYLRAGSLLTAILDTCHAGTMMDLEHYYCNRVWFPWYTLETETPKSRQESQTGSCDASTPETALLSNASPEMGHHPDRSSSFPKQISSVTSSPTPLNRILPHLGSPRSSQSLVVSRPSSAIDASSSSLSRSSEPKPYPGRKIRQNSVPLAHAPWLLESEKGLHSSPELIPLSLCQNCDGMTAMQSSRPLTSAKYRGGQVICLASNLDDQSSWITPEEKQMMTSVICEIIRKYNGDISLRELVSEAGNTMHHLTFGLMQHWKQHRNDFPVPFQTPQWGSMYPLNLDDQFSP